MCFPFHATGPGDACNGRAGPAASLVTVSNLSDVNLSILDASTQIKRNFWRCAFLRIWSMVVAQAGRLCYDRRRLGWEGREELEHDRAATPAAVVYHDAGRARRAP